MDKQGTPWTTDDEARLRELAAAGLPSKLIGRELGRSPIAVRKRASQLNVLISMQKVGSPYQTLALAFLRSVDEASVTDVEQHLGIKRSSAWRVLNALVKHDEAHIVRYIRGLRGTPTATFAAGPLQGEPAKPPRKLTRKEIEKRHIAKMRREFPEVIELRNKRLAASRRKPRTDIAASWIKQVEGKST